MKTRSFNRIVAALLCIALLAPNFTGLVTAVDSVSATPQSVLTNTKWVPAANPFASGEVPTYLTVNGSKWADTTELEYDCGNGLTADGAKSYMKLVTNTTTDEFLAYVNSLTIAGFTKTSSKQLQADESGLNNQFYRFLSPKKEGVNQYVLTAYFIEPYHEVRIIVDTAEDIVKSFSSGFVYDSTTNEVAQPMMTMYGLSMSPNGYDNTTTTAYSTNARNCGALIVIRMPDNSLFINDGGDIEQWSDEVCADFMKFCRELTGKQEGEKVVINTWFVSHAHTDHFDGIPRFFDQYHDQIDIKNVMYNIDDERLGTTRDMSPVMSMISGYFPNAKYYKPHTGETFNICGIQFDVLYTQEDRFVYNDDGKMIIDIRDGDDNNTNGFRDGTYRDFLYEAVDTPTLSDFNDTSTVLKVTFSEGLTGGDKVTSILYADVNLADQVIIDMWPDATLETDIMMVPHHGHDAHPELVELSKAKIFLYTQAKSAIYGPNGIVDKSVDQAGTYRPALVNNFNDMGGEAMFGTTATRKTYWEGTETACILFGEDTEFKNMPSGLSRDSEDPTGFTVYTMDAPFFEYGGWLSMTTVVASGSLSTGAVTTATPSIRLEGVEVDNSTTNYVLKDGNFYAIVHNKTNQLMIYNPSIYTTSAKNPAVAGSLSIGTQTQASRGEVATYCGTSDDYLYLDHSFRASALWELDFDALPSDKPYNTSSPRLGGSKNEYYHRSYFLKGTAAAGSFWNLDSSTVDNAFRYLQPNYEYVFNTEPSSYNIRIEFFINDNTTDVDDDGIVDVCDTCVIYYHNNTDKNDFRFLTVDEDGNWVRKDYASAAAAKADIENLKLRLYSYEPDTSAKKQVSMSGSSDYEVLRNTDADLVATYIASALTVKDTSTNLEVPCSGANGVVGHYWLDMSAYENLSATATSCTATVKYRNDNGTDTTIGTVNINVVDSMLMYLEYNDDDTVHAGTKYGSKYGFLYQGDTTIYEEVVECANLMDITYIVHNYDNSISSTIINVTADMLIDPETGKAVDTSVVGEHTGLQLVYNGEVVDDNFILNVASDEDALSNPAYPAPGSIVVNKQGTTTEKDFLKTGVANIQLSATGVPSENGVDLIIVMDLSGSMKNGLDTNVDAPNYEDSRIVALQHSLQSIVSDLQSTGKDVRVAMSDFGDLDNYYFSGSVVAKSIRDQAFYDINLNNAIERGYEFYNHLNWVIGADDQGAGPYGIIAKKYNLGHCSYTGQVIPEIYTGTGAVNAGAFVDVNSLDETAMSSIISKLDENIKKSIGTNYDIGLEYAYRLGYAIQQDNQSKGLERDLVCIFMSDGAAIQYNYYSGNSLSSSWNDYLLGIPEELRSIEGYYADSGNWPAEIEQISKVLLTKLTTEFNDTDNVYSTAYSTLFAPNYRSTCSDRYFTYVPDKTRDNAYYFYTYMDDQGYDIYDWDFLYRLAVANGYEDYIGQTFTEEYYHNTDSVLQYLVDLLTTPRGDSYITYKTDADGNPTTEIASFQSKLQNPDYRDLGRDDVQSSPSKVLVAQYKYYELANFVVDDTASYTDQFFAAMKSIGVDCDWALYARLAEKNKAAIQTEYGLVNPRDAFRTLIEKMKTPVDGYGDYQTLSPYDYFYNADGKNWWAEAIKGDPNKLYPVINKYAFEDNTAWGSDAYYGTVRNNFTTGTGLKLDGQDYISGFKGLGMDVYSISFAICADNQITAETAETVLKNVASGTSYFYSANSEQELTTALRTILSTMSTAATKGWFVDTMGENFNLSTEKTVVSHDGTVVTVNAAPSIKVMEYDIVRVTDANGNVTYQRTGEPRIVEVVTFEDMDGDGDTDAWSNLVYTTTSVDGNIVRTYTDIWNESTNVISAENFFYNANLDDYAMVSFGDQGQFPLAPESFFWVIGVIGEAEIVLEYQAYLVGSIEGERFLTGAEYYHATNTNADLHYINYLGQNVTLGTISPEYPWGDGRVGVGYYLVNLNGEIVSNQTTGETTTDFSQAIKLTRPEYQLLTWNAANTQASGSVSAAGFRPDGYSLYSPNASYAVDLNLNGGGSWTVTDSKNSTYVENRKEYFNTNKTFDENSYATGETVVWFAVVIITPNTMPDTVVIDYGLPVDIDVLGNDVLFGNKGTLAALGNYSANIDFSGTSLKSGYAVGTYNGTFGNAVIENGKVHYELTSTEMNASEKINYAVYYTPGAGEATTYKGYHYNTITIIPATTIYYEDSFLDYNTFKYNSSSNKYVETSEDKWVDVQDENYADFDGAHQDQDRPGYIELPEIDADNLYGFDSAYANCSKYSLGASKKFTANSDYAGNVSFNFYGTGFDVISLTNNDTGTIIVDVYEAEGYVQDQSIPVKSLIVDTYYGYTYDKENDEWVVTTNGNSLYQVPVMKVYGLEYGHYTAVITIAYSEYFDHKTADDSYEFYMDAVRIYNPARNDGSNDTQAGGAYVEDGEYMPAYKELRDILISEREFYDSTVDLGDGYLHGAVFIDGIPVLNNGNYDSSFKKDPPEIGTYLNYGPNNEVYLAPGQAIAFNLNSKEGLKAAHMAMKTTGGAAKIKLFPATAKITDINTTEINTATDRYYDLSELIGHTVIIANVGSSADGILSITNIKLTTDPNAPQSVSFEDSVTISKRSATQALNALTVGSTTQDPIPGEGSPDTGDAQLELMLCLTLIACLCVVTIVLLAHMDKRLMKQRRTR